MGCKPGIKRMLREAGSGINVGPDTAAACRAPRPAQHLEEDAVVPRPGRVDRAAIRASVGQRALDWSAVMVLTTVRPTGSMMSMVCRHGL